MDFEQTIKSRQSIRSFLPKEIEEGKIKKILELTNLAPSAGNLQAYKIYIVKNQKIKESLATAAQDQKFIAQAPIVLVFCANPQESAQEYKERGNNLYSIQDATITATYAQLIANNLGIGSVWIGAFDPVEIKKILKINDLLPVAIIPLGYPKEIPPKRSRKKLDDLIIKIY